MIQIVAVDLDGTLLRSDKTLSQRTLQAIHTLKDTGRRIVIATARPPRTVSQLLPEVFEDDIWICYNGAVIVESGRILYENLIHPPNTQKIVELLQLQIPECNIALEIDGKAFVNRPLRDARTFEVVDLSSMFHKPAAKIYVELGSYSSTEFSITQLPSTCKALITDNGKYIQIMSNTASKAEALTFLLGKMALSWKNVMAFGDDINDSEIIRASGVGIAMENAIPEVKAVADQITKSNDKDGVAIFLESMLCE